MYLLHRPDPRTLQFQYFLLLWLCDLAGVYVEGRKVASVGLRVRRGGSYHGMALNIDVDLEPFSRINPCGFSDLEVTDLTAFGIKESRTEIQARVQAHLLRHLRMDDRRVVSDI